MTDKESITQIDHETVMGKIIYLSNKEERKKVIKQIEKNQPNVKINDWLNS